ncbi:MAG: hypothetical protein AAFR65_04650 [Pseudomonadota bacterium]
MFDDEHCIAVVRGEAWNFLGSDSSAYLWVGCSYKAPHQSTRAMFKVGRFEGEGRTELSVEENDGVYSVSVCPTDFVVGQDIRRLNEFIENVSGAFDQQYIFTLKEDNDLC